MRIAVVAPSPVPFGPGGAEALWSGLYQHLLRHTGHDVELIKVPIRESTLPEVMAAYETFAGLDLDHFDLVVSGKYPAWMVRHPRHVVYLLHPLRGLYDAYGLFHRPFAETSTDPAVRLLLDTSRGVTRETLPTLFDRWRQTLAKLGPDHPVMGFPGPLARTLVRDLDGMAMAPDQVKRHCAISWTVAGRAGYFPDGVPVRVVHPPSDLAGLHGGDGQYFFTASRHDAPKRLDLLIRGMQHYGGDRRLLIAGVGPETERLRELAAGDPRVELVGRVSQAELVEHYSRSVGVPFLPLDEDLGLITYEAMASGKPVLTTHDSGGPTEFVTPGRNGVVVAPEPAAIGAGLAALEQLAADPAVADAARATIRAQSWDRVVAVLLDERPQRVSAHPAALPARRGKPRLVVTSTFPVWPPRGGGQLRAFHLYGALTEAFDVDLVCQAAAGTAQTTTMLRPGLVEHVVPRSDEHAAAENEITAKAGTPVTDIVASRLSRLTPAYEETLADLVRGSAGVVLADPFLAPLVARVVPGMPTIYDAYNCEAVLKRQLLPTTAVGDELLAEVLEVEGLAARTSALVLTVSAEDRAALQSLYDVQDERFADAPNGTDLDTVRYVGPEQRAARRDRWLAADRRAGGPPLRALALFVGSWHEPNNAAARHVVALADELPEVGFLLVGNHVGALSEVRLPRNVMAVGLVPDLVKLTLLGAVDVALAPMTSGSGTNLKVVEYLAAGVPVVSTPIGLRGLELPEDAATVAEVADFAEAIRRTLADPPTEEVRARIAAAVHRRYDWRVIGRDAAPRIAAALGVRA